MTGIRRIRALLGRVGEMARPSRLRRLEHRFGPLPLDFVARRYRALHPDIRDWSEEAAAEHYLVHGRPEGRPYRPAISWLAAELANFRGTPETEAEEALVAFLKQAGLEPGLWLERLSPEAFWAANESWLDRQPDTAAAVLVAFVEQGLSRLAPLT